MIPDCRVLEAKHEMFPEVAIVCKEHDKVHKINYIRHGPFNIDGHTPVIKVILTLAIIRKHASRHQQVRRVYLHSIAKLITTQAHTK